MQWLTDHQKRENHSSDEKVKPHHGAGDHVSCWSSCLIEDLGGQNACHPSCEKTWWQAVIRRNVSIASLEIQTNTCIHKTLFCYDEDCHNTWSHAKAENVGEDAAHAQVRHPGYIVLFACQGERQVSTVSNSKQPDQIQMISEIVLIFVVRHHITFTDFSKSKFCNINPG